jgi:hypothetical protein
LQANQLRSDENSSAVLLFGVSVDSGKNRYVAENIMNEIPVCLNYSTNYDQKFNYDMADISKNKIVFCPFFIFYPKYDIILS